MSQTVFGRSNRTGGVDMSRFDEAGRVESGVESTSTPFTPARVVALVVIVGLVLGLGYLRFEPGATSMSVPRGAKAGDLRLKPCTYQTEKGGYAADCGTLVVPENRADPGSRLIALPVTRIRAQSGHSREPIFYLEGGPGITNMEFTYASRYVGDRDLVLVGYRGVDGSVRLDCPEVESALKHSSDVLGEKSFRAYADGFRACADRLTADGVDLAGYGMAQQVDDLETVRAALGYGRIHLLSQSAGTRTALIYVWRHPESIDRSVMIGVNPPGHFLWDAKTTDEQIGRYAELCSKDASCSKRTDDLAASMRQTAVSIPDRWFFLPIKEGNVRVASLMGLMESSSEGTPFAAPLILDGWLSAANGDASGLWAASLLSDLLFPKMFVWGEYAGFGRPDAKAGRDYFSSGGQGRDANLGYAASAFIWGGGRLIDAWPSTPGEGEYSQVRTSEVETLIVNGELDFSTPPQVATKELLPYLPNGHEVVLAGIGHTASFFAVQPEAGSRLINTFFDTGRVDDSLYQPQKVDFTPAMSLTAIAKIVAGTMVGFALLAVVLLLWMARRVRKRGRFGTKASTALRSVVPIVLGLGGWFLGALIVLATMTWVSLDNQALATLSVGSPVGLGIYLAWTHRDWSDTTKIGGFAGAMGGALVGGWLGFHSTAGLLAILTTIVGAAVGANLVLIILDISRAQSERRLAPSSLVEPVREPVHA
jgi:pimeloyl-ACP methyl ester carboxylesterase